MYRYRMYRYFHTGMFFLVTERSGRRPGSEATLLLQALCNRVSATTAVTFVKSKAGERPLLESYSLFPTVSIIIFSTLRTRYLVPGTAVQGVKQASVSWSAARAAKKKNAYVRTAKKKPHKKM